MELLRITALLLACTAVFCLVVGVSGVSSVSADRNVSMRVTDESHAFVGVEACDATNESTEPSGTVLRIRISNQYVGTFDITEVEDQANTEGTSFAGIREIGPGRVVTFTVSLDVSDPETVRVHVSGDSFSAVVSSVIDERGDCAFG